MRRCVSSARDAGASSKVQHVWCGCDACSSLKVQLLSSLCMCSKVPHVGLCYVARGAACGGAPVAAAAGAAALRVELLAVAAAAVQLLSCKRVRCVARFLSFVVRQCAMAVKATGGQQGACECVYASKMPAGSSNSYLSLQILLGSSCWCSLAHSSRTPGVAGAWLQLVWIFN